MLKVFILNMLKRFKQLRFDLIRIKAIRLGYRRRWSINVNCYGRWHCWSRSFCPGRGSGCRSRDLWVLARPIQDRCPSPASLRRRMSRLCRSSRKSDRIIEIYYRFSQSHRFVQVPEMGNTRTGRHRIYQAKQRWRRRQLIDKSASRPLTWAVDSALKRLWGLEASALVL